VSAWRFVFFQPHYIPRLSPQDETGPRSGVLGGGLLRFSIVTTLGRQALYRRKTLHMRDLSAQSGLGPAAIIHIAVTMLDQNGLHPPSHCAP